MEEVKNEDTKALSRSFHSSSLVHTHEVVCLDGADATSCHTSSLLFTTFCCSRLLFLTGEHLMLEVWLDTAY